MKTLLSTIALILCLGAQAYSQVSIGLRVGKGPNVSPGTNHIFVNRQEAFNESLFNVEQVRYSPQIGVMARMDLEKFWFMSELTYGQITTQYSMIYTAQVESGQTSGTFNEKRAFLEIPVSAGVSLGMIDVFSGLSVAHDFGFKNELETIEGYTSSLPAMRWGWHTGVGVNFGHILIDIRYQQEFGNYGEDRYINGQELLLKSAPARVIATAAYRI